MGPRARTGRSDQARERLPPGTLYDRVERVYRLTDSGWNAMNRSHGWTLVGAFLAFLSLLATIAVAGL